MNFIQEVLSLLERKQNKKTLDLKRDWFEFGRTKPSNVGNPLYSPKMTPHAIRFDDLKCEIITGLVQGTGARYTLPMWDEQDPTNCNVQTMVDSIFSQDANATEGLISGDFRVAGNTVLEGDLLVLGQQTIVESTIVQVADNIFRINSGGSAVDAGIEVIQPSGTKTWAWDNAQGMWSTFGDNIRTEDIFINGAIHQDGESLVNVVNEAEGLASQDNDNSLATVAAIIDYVDTSVAGGGSGGSGSGTGVNGVDKAEYEVIYTTDANLTQAGPGQLVFNQATDEIYMSWHDLNSNDRKYALETILYSPGKKPFGLFTADIADPWVNYNAQYFNPCGTEILGINCLPWDGTTPNLNPTQGTTGDDGGGGIPIDIVWSSSSAGIKQGGQGAVYATVYVHPDVIGATIQTPVMSGSGLSFVNEPIDDPKALATAFSNPGYVTFNPPLADPFTIYLNSSMTTIAGGGYYMERSEFDNLPSGSFGYISNWDDASQSWNKDIVSFKNPAATPAAGDPELICTVNSRSLAVSIAGADQFVIPWIQGQQKGTGWAPQSAPAIVTLDMAGKEECLVGANGSTIAFDETVTDVAYDEDQNILGHVDEEGVISLMPLVGAQLEAGTLIDITNGVISHAEPTFTGTIVSSSINLNYGQTIAQQLVVGQDTNNPLLGLRSDGYGHITGTNFRALSMPDWLGITDVVLNGTDLQFTSTAGSFGGFSDSVDLSPLLDDTNDIDYVSDVQLSGTDLQFTGVGNGFSGTVDLSALGGGAGNEYILQPATGGFGLVNSGTSPATIVDIVKLSPGAGITVNYSTGANNEMQFQFIMSDVARTDTNTSESPDHTETFTVIDAISTNSRGQVTDVNTKTITLPASGTGADGNDFVSNVTFDSNTNVLDFTGTGGAFNGSINLAALASTETLTSLQFSGGNLIYIDENNNGTNIAALDIAPVQQVLGDGQALSSTYDTQTGVTTITPIYNNQPTQNSQALVNSGGIWAYIDALTYPNDFVNNVQFNSADNTLDFSGTGGAFNATVDLSGLSGGDYILSQATGGFALVDQSTTPATTVNTVKLSPGNGMTINATTGAGGEYIYTFEADVSSADLQVDYIQDVELNGTNLDFTAVGNGFTGSIDLSSFLDDTNATYTLGLAAGGSNDTVVTLTGAGGGANSQFTIAGGAGISVVENLSTNTISISSTITDTNTTYDLSSGQNGDDVDITLDGSDGTADAFTLVAGTNITLTDNGTNQITIDAAGGSSSYTFGTYLTETGGTVNHNSTTRSDTTSTAAPVHGDTFTAVDSVTTNATGHVTGINVKTVTLPSDQACMFGVNFQPVVPQSLLTQFFVIGNGTPDNPLGFRNNSNEERRYVLTWTVQLIDDGTGGAGVKGFDYRVVQNSQTAPSTLIEWNDSQYTIFENALSRTYTYTTSLIPHDDTIEIQVSGASSLGIVKAHLSVVDVTCDSIIADDASLLDPRN